MIGGLLFGILVTGLLLLLGVLHVMRALYASGICAAPEFPPKNDELSAGAAKPDYTGSQALPGYPSTPEGARPPD
jgi:hypothetical protein